jgi:hypothetical protein
MSCNTPQIVEERIICAKICTEKFNDTPISEFKFENYVLYDNSEYFDNGDISYRQIRWRLYIEDFLILDFGYGGYLENIVELGNGSTFSELKLGIKNTDILAYIESLPNTIVPVGTKFTLYLDVKDNTGIESQNISNKYCFTK